MRIPGVRWLAFFVLLCLAGLIGWTVFFHNPEGDMFMSHAHCYLFNRQLMLLHGWSDLVIGLSYVAISCTLLYLVFRLRQELPFHWMMLAFAIFIVACGVTHFMEVWTLHAEHPRYWLSGEIKLLTAVASLITAIMLPPLVPKIRALLRSSRLAISRKDALEKAYAELDEIYDKVLALAPEDDPVTAVKTPGQRGSDPDEFPRDLAVMARKVTLHARELERAKQEAEAANRAKDEFLAVLSHELRAPLTPALASASFLESTPNATPEELRESISLIRRNIELEARLVDDLLDVTRISNRKLEIHHSNVDLHEAVHHAIDMCDSPALSKRVDFDVHLDAVEHYVEGDGARLAQVFWNIIQNAIKFSNAKGRITIKSSNPDAGSVRVEITDDGIGIEPGILPKIFDPFEQGETSLPRRLGGVGLGLSIAKALVEAHRGSISVHSEGKDKGTTFFIQLPTIPAPIAKNKSGQALPAGAPQQRSLRILVVEDHADARNVMVRILTRWGHVAKPAATISEALEIAAQFEPELLLTDIGLPDGTGTELLGQIKKLRDIPSIAMSGYGMEIDIKQSKLAGFAAHLVKPVAVERLKNAIAALFPD